MNKVTFDEDTLKLLVEEAVELAVQQEREACAKVGKYALPNHSDLGLVVEAAIRARGQA